MPCIAMIQQLQLPDQISWLPTSLAAITVILSFLFRPLFVTAKGSRDVPLTGYRYAWEPAIVTALRFNRNASEIIFDGFRKVLLNQLKLWTCKRC